METKRCWKRRINSFLFLLVQNADNLLIYNYVTYQICSLWPCGKFPCAVCLLLACHADRQGWLSSWLDLFSLFCLGQILYIAQEDRIKFSVSHRHSSVVDWSENIFIFIFLQRSSRKSAWCRLNFGPSLSYDRWSSKWIRLFWLLRGIPITN